MDDTLRFFLDVFPDVSGLRFRLDLDSCSWRSSLLNANQRWTAMAERNFLPLGETHNLSMVSLPSLPLLLGRVLVENSHPWGRLDCCVKSFLVIRCFLMATSQGDEESGIFFFQSRALMIDHHFRVKKIAPLVVASRISWNSVDPLPYI